MLDYGFKDLGLNRIEIKCAVENLKSARVPEKLNFTKEGILRQAELLNGKFVDLYLFSLLKNEWI
jgi:ribosomal-protein-serine acetyltransferase